MDQTRKGRAYELELKRFSDLIESLPQPPQEKTEHVVINRDESEQRVSIEHLVAARRDDPVATIILCVSHLCCEADRLAGEAASEHLPRLLIYGEQDVSDGSDAASIGRVSRFLPALHRLTMLAARCSCVFRELIRQIRAYTTIQGFSTLPSDRSLERAWRAAGDLLAVQLQLDEAVRSAGRLRHEWQVYCKAIDTARHNPEQLGASATQLSALASLTGRVEMQLMSGCALRTACEQSAGQEVDSDGKFAEHMKSTVHGMLQKWHAEAAADVPDRRRLVVLTALTVYFHIHFSSTSTRCLKAVWQTSKKLPSFHLLGDVVWLPCLFLLKEVPETRKRVADTKTITWLENTRDRLFEQQSHAMIDEAADMLEGVKEWRALLSVALRRQDGVKADCLAVTEMVLKGARLSDTMCRLLRTVLCSQRGQAAMTRDDMCKMMRVLAAVKSISSHLAAHAPLLLEHLRMAGQQWRCHLISLLERVKSTGNAGVAIAQACLMATESRTRLITASVALEVAGYKKLVGSADAAQVEQLLQRCATVADPRTLMARVSDCSFLLWHRRLVPLMCDTVWVRRVEPRQVQLLFSALSDMCLLATRLGDTATSQDCEKMLYEEFKKAVLVPLCGAVEADVRVCVHSHLQLPDRDRRPSEEVWWMGRLMSTGPIRVAAKRIDPREFVSRYLERTFYNLTAVALHDCHTYARMTAVAHTRYRVSIVPSRLPHRTLDQGMDAVAVMRSLRAFCQHFAYNSTQQVFIERDSPSRHLRVVSTARMADSLRTHGRGVLATAVNLVYQLVRGKWAVLGRFLGEEHVCALLQREVRQFETRRDEWNRMYPVKRAERVNRSLGQLSPSEQTNCMDRLRQLVTEMGNALGVVRCMASAGAQLASQKKEYAGGEEQTEETEQGKKEEEEQVVNTERDYVELLVRVFRGGDSSSLSLFWAALPALTLNYVDHVTTARERARRRGAQPGKQITLSDDGFVMGVAFALSVLQQWPQFTAFNWFASVLKTCQSESSRVSADSRAGKENQSATLKAARLQAYAKELKMLSYTLQSARVFFITDQDDQ